jgi:conjugal transfer pilus assembly protein TraF
MDIFMKSDATNKVYRLAKKILVYKLVILLFCISQISNVIAADSYYLESHRGWFWYEEPKKEDSIKEIEPEINANINNTKQFSDDSKYTAETLRIMLPKALDIALDEPSIDNVRNYFLLQKMAMDKSERFSIIAQRLPLLGSEFDELGKRAQYPQAAQIKNETSDKFEQQILEKISAKAGIFFYYKGSCNYCHLAIRQVNDLAKVGFKVLGISLDGEFIPELNAYRQVNDTGVAAASGVVSVPTIALIAPDSKQHYAIVANSLLQDHELRLRIIRAAILLDVISEKEVELLKL